MVAVVVVVLLGALSAVWRRSGVWVATRGDAEGGLAGANFGSGVMGGGLGDAVVASFPAKLVRDSRDELTSSNG